MVQIWVISAALESLNYINISSAIPWHLQSIVKDDSFSKHGKAQPH